MKMFSRKWERNIKILIKFYIFWFYSKCPSNFWLSYSSIFDLAIIVLKIVIFLSSVRFLIFHIFNTTWISVIVVWIFFPPLLFHFKRNEYLIFWIYHYLDLYNAYHRLSLGPLSGLQYLQFQILLSLVLIQKSAKKNYQPYVW